MAGPALALCTEIGTMATIPYKTDQLETGTRHGRRAVPILAVLTTGNCGYAADVIYAVVDQCAKTYALILRLATKKGQSHLTIGPSGKLVAGTGFEPVTFGL